MKLNQLLLLNKIHDKTDVVTTKNGPPKKKIATANASFAHDAREMAEPAKLAASGIKNNQGTMMYQNYNTITDHSLSLGTSSIKDSDNIDIKKLFHQINEKEKPYEKDATMDDDCDEKDESHGHLDV